MQFWENDTFQNKVITMNCWCFCCFERFTLQPWYCGNGSLKHGKLCIYYCNMYLF